MNKCYRCGRVSKKGKYLAIAIDDKHDEVYKEWFCWVCLDLDSENEIPISGMADEEME